MRISAYDIIVKLRYKLSEFLFFKDKTHDI